MSSGSDKNLWLSGLVAGMKPLWHPKIVQSDESVPIPLPERDDGTWVTWLNQLTKTPYHSRHIDDQHPRENAIMTELFEKNDLRWQHQPFLSSFGQWRAKSIVDSSESMFTLGTMVM